MIERLEPAEPRIRKIVARAIGRPTRRVHFAVWLHRYRTSLGFAAAVSQVANEFLTRVELCACRLVPIEIADKTNAKRNIVQIIAVHMTPVDLPTPAIADFDLTITRRCAVPDNEVICEAVLHAANMLMVIIKNTRIALPGAAIVYDNELPATPFHRRAPNRFDDRTCQVTVTDWATPRPETESARRR